MYDNFDKKSLSSGQIECLCGLTADRKRSTLTKPTFRTDGHKTVSPVDTGIESRANKGERPVCLPLR